MLRIDSLKSKINLIFFIALILLVFLFGALWKSTRTRSLQEIEMQERANIHYLYLYFLKNRRIDTDYLESQNFRIVDAGAEKMRFKKLIGQNGKKRKFIVMDVKFHRYILINNDRFQLVLENLNKPRLPIELAIAFAGALGLLLLLYVWIIRSIKPLSELKEKIIKFSQGDLNIECHSERRDEIAEVANAFDHAVHTIRDLLHSRQLLLRAIMHELKTPIAKGRLLSEMIDDSGKRERFHTIFKRLNLLIDEFAKVEQITSKNFRADFRMYKMSDILEGSIDMLMLDDPSRSIHSVVRQDQTVRADFELITLAVKNLIDNGLKYSTDKKIDLLIDGPKLRLRNKGKKLKEPLEHYFLPFHSSDGGLGLGLYIVKSILDIHGAQLEYTWEKDINLFTVKMPLPDDIEIRDKARRS